jgi:hypothetical protein
MRRRMMVPLTFLIGIWFMTGSAITRTLDNITVNFMADVADTLSAGGNKNREAETLTLMVQNSPEQKWVSVPDVNGMNWKEAKALLESKGFRVALNEVAALNCGLSSAGKAMGVSGPGRSPIPGTAEVGTQLTLSYCEQKVPRKTPPSAGRFDILGTEWVVHEGEGLRYPAKFTRIGNTNVFAATFDGHNHPTNRVTITISGGTVTMERDQAPITGDKESRRKCTYNGRLYKGDGSTDLNMAEGTLNCNFFRQYGIRNNLPWRAKILGQRRQ